jgi:LuxR family maltose regulon positive regulatory protein
MPYKIKVHEMKQNSVSLAKITRPSLSGVFPRERLFHLLDRGRDRSIICISGPPGSGKTTLVGSYLDARKLHNLWYRIDESDADVATFFYYMSVASKKIEPRKRAPLPVFTPKYLKNISAFTRRYFEDFYSQVKRTPFVVVFDNYHKIPAGSVFHEMICTGLAVIPKNVNLILISRSEIPSVLARIRANYLPEFIGWNELRLTPEELDGIIRMRGLIEPSKETIQVLHSKTDGWVAGLVLMLEKLKKENIDTRLLNKLTPDEVFDYFATEVFEKMNAGVQDFLLKTALFPRMTPKMAENLTGQRRAGRILKDLNRSNYFTEKYLQNEAVYQYHPLFREFLLSCARDTFTQTTLSSVQRRAASILAEFNQIEDAIGLFCETCNWEGLVKLINKHARSLVTEGRNQTLERWLAGLPKDVVENTPWLFYWKGVCCMPFSPEQSCSYFDKAFQLFKAQENIEGIYLAWSGVIDSIVYNFELTRLDQWISTLEDHMHRVRGFPSEKIEARVASCMFTALALRQPQHPEIETWAERAMALSQKSEDISIKIQTLVHLAWHRIWSGDFAEAALLINSLLEITQSGDVTTLALLSLKNMEAFYCWLTAKHEQCQKAVSDGLELARKTGVKIMDSLFLGHGIANALSTGDLVTSKRLLQKMASSLMSFQDWSKSFYHSLVTWEALIRRDLAKALLHADLALKLAHEAGIIQTEAICHIERAQVMHEIGEYKKAEDYLELARDISRKVKSQLIEFMCFLTESIFAFDREDGASGLVSLRKAMTIGRRQGYLNTFIWREPVMTRLCVKAIEAGIEVEYVQDLIKRRGLFPDMPPLHIENWPWPVKIFTLGRFGLVRDGKPVQFSGKVQKKPLSMLKVLITLGGRNVSEDQLMDILWFDADGDVAHKSFATTLHRLRKLIGNEKAILLREGRVTLDHRYCWVDVWAFERIIGQVDAAWKGGPAENNMTQTIQLSEKAVEMYKGPFLSGETDQPWTISFRERLRSKFLRSVGQLGLYWEQVEDFNKAVNCYQKGLEVDDLAEEFYQCLMTCFQRLGRRAEALTVYNRCRNTLSTALGVEPSLKTDAIYKSLLSD